MQVHTASYLADQDVEPPAKRARYGTASLLGRYREVGLMRKDEPQTSSTFLGSSSGIYFVQSVYKALQNGTTAPAPRQTVPGEDDSLPCKKNVSLWTATEVADVASIDFSSLKDLSDEYFNHWHLALPFLRGTSALRILDDISQMPLGFMEQSIDQTDLTIARAILSTAAADRRQCGSERAKAVPRQLLFSSYRHAVGSIQSQLVAPTTLRSLQAVLAVQLFLMSMLRHNAAMRLSGLAVRMVFQLGLHRCPARYTTFAADEIELRKRVFWTAYCLDRMLCQSLGLPLSIKDDDIDVCLFDEEKHVTSTTTIALAPSLATLHFLSKHAEIEGMIVELCNKNISRRPNDFLARSNIEEAMLRWQNEMDTFIDLTPANTTFHKSRRTTLEVLRFESIIALNRPLLALPKDSPDYKQALQTCISAARTIIATLHSRLIAHLARVASRDATKALSPLTWPTCTSMVWLGAFIVMYAAGEHEIQLDAARQLVNKSIDVLEHLAARNTHWPSICAFAIKELSQQLDTRAQHTGMNEITSETLPKISPPFNGTTFLSSLDQDIDLGETALFDGFDIPFWLGDDQHSELSNLWTFDDPMG